MSEIPDYYNFRRPFFDLAIVNILSNLMVPLAGLVDVAFLGHLAEIRHLAGVALATVLFNYLYWTFGFFRMGTTGTTAQAMGRGDWQESRIILLRNGLMACSIGVLILLFQVPLREIGFHLLSAAPEVKASARDYYNALIWGAPATLINFVILGWFLGRSQGNKVLLLSVVSNCTNVGLNYLLIVRWGWESAGAGWGTALSQYAMFLVGLAFLLPEFQQIRVEGMPPLWDIPSLKATFSLNGDILIRTFALVSSFALFTNLSAGLGTEVLAANSLLLQVLTLAAYFIDGIAFATESYAGIFKGRGETQSLMALLRLSGAISLVLGLAFAGAFILFQSFLFNLLTNHSAILEQVSRYVGWLIPVIGFGAIAFMLDGYFLGLTAGRILRNASLTAAILGFVPGAIAAYYLQNNQLLWLAMSCYMAARVITLGVKVPETLCN